MPILHEGRSHALVLLLVLVPAQEFAVLGDLDPGVEVLGLQDEDIERPMQEQMVNLRNASVEIEPQVDVYRRKTMSREVPGRSVSSGIRNGYQ